MSYFLTNSEGQALPDKYENFSEALDTAQKSNLNVFKEEKGGSFPLWKANDDPYLKAYEEYTYEQWESVGQGHHETSDKPSVYFDIDGTLGKWYSDMRGYDYEDITKGSTHYFRDIEPQEAVVELAKMLHEEGYDVCIMSAAAKDTIRDKWEWIEDNLPFIPKENICFCPLGADKSEFVKGNADISVLIDDYQKNLDEWQGKSIKLLNGINHFDPNISYVDITDTHFDLKDAVRLVKTELEIEGEYPFEICSRSHGEEYNRLLDDREARISDIRNEVSLYSPREAFTNDLKGFIKDFVDDNKELIISDTNENLDGYICEYDLLPSEKITVGISYESDKDSSEPYYVWNLFKDGEYINVAGNGTKEDILPDNVLTEMANLIHDHLCSDKELENISVQIAGKKEINMESKQNEQQSLKQAELDNYIKFYSTFNDNTPNHIERHLELNGIEDKSLEELQKLNVDFYEATLDVLLKREIIEAMPEAAKYAEIYENQILEGRTSINFENKIDEKEDISDGNYARNFVMWLPSEEYKELYERTTFKQDWQELQNDDNAYLYVYANLTADKDVELLFEVSLETGEQLKDIPITNEEKASILSDMERAAQYYGTSLDELIAEINEEIAEDEFEGEHGVSKTIALEMYEGYKEAWIEEHIDEVTMTATEAQYENSEESENMTFQQYVETYGYADGSVYVSFEEFVENELPDLLEAKEEARQQIDNAEALLDMLYGDDESRGDFLYQMGCRSKDEQDLVTQQVVHKYEGQEFISDPDKMQDFKELSKDEFLESYSYLTEDEYRATEVAVTKELCEFYEDTHGDNKPVFHEVLAEMETNGVAATLDYFAAEVAQIQKENPEKTDIRHLVDKDINPNAFDASEKKTPDVDKE